MMPAAEISPTSMMQKGLFFLSAPAVYMVCSSALSQFLQAPFHSAAKTCASAFPPQLSLLHICDHAGVEITAMCVEIADSRPLQRSPVRIACALWLPR